MEMQFDNERQEYEKTIAALEEQSEQREEKYSVNFSRYSLEGLIVVFFRHSMIRLSNCRMNTGKKNSIFSIK